MNRNTLAITLTLAATMALGLVLCASSQAAPPYETSGMSDPAAVPFSAVPNLAGAPAAVVGGGNDGEDFWRIHQEPLVSDIGSSYYRGVLAAGDTSDASGWTLTYRAKLGRALNAQFNSYFAVVDDTGHGYIIDLVGGEGEPTPHVGYLKAADPFPAFSTLSPIDPTLAYHTYQMIFNPAAGGSTGYYIDGTLIDTLTPAGVYSGIGGGTRLEWGRGQGTGGVSETQWSLIRFEVGQHVVPEPSTYVLLGLGGLSLLWRRKLSGTV